MSLCNSGEIQTAHQSFYCNSASSVLRKCVVGELNLNGISLQASVSQLVNHIEEI